jgi:cyclic beta-1,2-glucan synthetase
VRAPNHNEEPDSHLARPTDLLFDNGLGGFSPDGREYVIYLKPGQTTPAPWINVVANAGFGFLVSEAGASYSWAVNSGENRLTPWSNDPLLDPAGEAIYLRDEETGEVWSPAPALGRGRAPYLVRHGCGYTSVEQWSHGLRQRLRYFVAPDAPVKIVQLRLENTRRQARRMTVTFYAEWVLGVLRDGSQQYIVPEFDAQTQALLARNAYNAEFSERMAFAAASRRLHGLTADRAEFLGRMGSIAHPAALNRIGLSGAVEAGRDPCAALQVHLDVPPGTAEEVYFLLGEAEDRQATLQLIHRFQDPQQVEMAWSAAASAWDNLLGQVQVTTPEPAMNLLLNRWLLYQTLACRVWARSAFYQPSGAYGFRDQLQDVLALVHAAPQAAREHIMRAVHCQFEQGDALHWWHPPSGRGVRTRISDNLLWLPFVTARYVAATGDETILSEKTPFLTAPPLEPGEEERYGLYASSADSFSLYEHCKRAIARGATSGPHGLPLMGSGDWNDGMNRVGIHGRGESVWLGWFLSTTLREFAAICRRQGDAAAAEGYVQRAEQLRQALEASAWDGAWYRRAFFDDGTPLGSTANRECRIDSIAQSWAVLSGAAERARARQAVDSALAMLRDDKNRLVLLFTPPFDTTLANPGYIKGYAPGVRENGGQYTHGALWLAWALATMGRGDDAEALFRLLNPIYHADTPEKVGRYKVEPYVVAADVYKAAGHVGRGGWTWYTGSAAWMYRLGLEAILGVQRAGPALHIDPCIPKAWPGYDVVYRAGAAALHIRVENPQGVSRGIQKITLDGQVLPGNDIPIPSAGEHQVVVVLGSDGMSTRP